MISQQFKQKLKLWHEPQYRVAIKAGIHPGLLSKWVIGAQPVKRGDPRIIRVAKILGLKQNQIFEEVKVV